MATGIPKIEALAVRLPEKAAGEEASGSPAERKSAQKADAATTAALAGSSSVAKVTPRAVVPSVTFEVDPQSGELFIQVVDRETGEVIRQIPSEEIREMAKALEAARGRVFDILA